LVFKVRGLVFRVDFLVVGVEGFEFVVWGGGLQEGSEWMTP